MNKESSRKIILIKIKVECQEKVKINLCNIMVKNIDNLTRKYKRILKNIKDKLNKKKKVIMKLYENNKD